MVKEGIKILKIIYEENEVSSRKLANETKKTIQGIRSICEKLIGRFLVKKRRIKHPIAPIGMNVYSIQPSQKQRILRLIKEQYPDEQQNTNDTDNQRL